MNLSMTHSSTGKRNHVRHYPGRDDDYAVQVFFSDDAHFSLYMGVEEARQFANDILAALPVEVEA